MNYIKSTVNQIYKKYQQDESIKNKYDKKQGIYSISVNNRIIYIGKSANILNRICYHIFYINNPELNKSNKYRVIANLLSQGVNIQFNLVQLVDNIVDLDKIEGQYIRKYLPPLNYQIPREEDCRKYTVNRIAKNITAEYIIEYSGLAG